MLQRNPTDGFHLPRTLLDYSDAKEINKKIDNIVQRSKYLYKTYKKSTLKD